MKVENDHLDRACAIVVIASPASPVLTRCEDSASYAASNLCLFPETGSMKQAPSCREELSPAIRRIEAILLIEEEFDLSDHPHHAVALEVLAGSHN